jgi:hypothetical protein
MEVPSPSPASRAVCALLSQEYISLLTAGARALPGRPRGIGAREVRWLEVRWLEVRWLEVRWLEVRWLEVRWLEVRWLEACLRCA